MKPRVLVTRPEPGNAQTAARLARAGFKPACLPLTQVSGIACDPPETRPDIVAVSSPNAIRFASAALLKSLSNIPVHAVGATSARSAADAGLTVVHAGTGDASDLASHLIAMLKPDSIIAYPCGRVRRPDFESALASAGHPVLVLETYDTNKVSYSTNNTEVQVGAAAVDAVLVHSASTAAVLNDLMETGRIPQVTDDTVFFSLSERISRTLKHVSSDRRFHADRPAEQVLLDLLSKRFQ